MNKDWIRVLEGLRFDIVRREPLQARKEYDSRQVAEVTLDDSGQVRLVVTRDVAETKSEKRASRAGRTYQVYVEQKRVTLVNYRLRAGDDLGAVLTEMEKEIAK
ncbi:hypothetical protein ANRL1_03712 [Anaerolineae bacterium]|nr:hypothetical protein ANRL1_03712 [Anaerolineae bacterium]